MNPRAMSGISTLIIFIAAILIAAVSAMVLLQTTQSLQSQAVATSHESKEQVSAQFIPVTVMADINKDNLASVRALKITLKLAPGSQNLPLNKLILNITGGRGSNAFSQTGITYRQSIGNSDTNCIEALGAQFDWTQSNDPLSWDLSSSFIDPSSQVGNVYSVKWNGAAPADKTIVRPDDAIEICYNVNNRVIGKDNILIDIVPVGSTPSQITLTTDPSFSKRFEQLFP